MLFNKTLMSIGAIVVGISISLVSASPSSASSDSEKFQSKRSTMLSKVFGKRDCNFDCGSNGIPDCDSRCQNSGIDKFLVSACVGGKCYCGFDPAMYPSG
ncbi:hypothetical protein BDC45DRAFT_497957 [Circinella umbellata]|nr:hypothetical protein BDC45DRAFT_497957 [Circinella umbellata]